MSQHTRRKPDRVIGRYALFGQIASGGMATVHYGRLLGPVGFARTVAIKRLHPQFARDPEFVSMFLDEARLAARIRHPNVVPTLDVVATVGELFLVMEYVQGESLARLLREARDQGKPVPAKVAASILSGALQGLHAAHEARDERGMSLGIVHRDISPQNIMVGADGMTRVLDFGVAKAAGRIHTTRKGNLKGKLAYMAPEQLENEEITRQADIYAAAVVLWEALTNSRLFKGDSEAVVLARVLGGEVTLPSKMAPGCPAAFDPVVLRGLARQPADRYTSALDMAIALERCAGVESHAEVALWLKSVAGKTLRQRAERIAAIESDSEVSDIGDLQAFVRGISEQNEPTPSQPSGDLPQAKAASVWDGPLDIDGSSETAGIGDEDDTIEEPPRAQIPGTKRIGWAIPAAIVGLFIVVAGAAVLTRGWWLPKGTPAGPSAASPTYPSIEPLPLDSSLLVGTATGSESETEPGEEDAGEEPDAAPSASSPKKPPIPVSRPTKTAPTSTSPFDELGGRR